MPETLVAPQTPIVQAEPIKETPKESLVTRASKVQTPEKPEIPGEVDPVSFNTKELEKIADPVARKLAEDAYKSFQADYTRKTQAIASERKGWEAQMAALQNKSYNISDIQKMLQDPTFVQAATEFQRLSNPEGFKQPFTNGNGHADLSQEEISYLAPEQQTLYFKEKKNEDALRAINSRLQAAEMEKEDMSLKGKYANYESQTVNQVYQDMMSGKLQATREHLWKVVDYDRAVERAYHLGLEDRKLNLGEKVNASSQPSSVSVAPSDDVPAKLQGESNIEFFKRIAMKNMTKHFKK